MLLMQWSKSRRVREILRVLSHGFETKEMHSDKFEL